MPFQTVTGMPPSVGTNAAPLARKVVANGMDLSVWHTLTIQRGSRAEAQVGVEEVAKEVQEEDALLTQVIVINPAQARDGVVLEGVAFKEAAL